MKPSTFAIGGGVGIAALGVLGVLFGIFPFPQRADITLTVSSDALIAIPKSTGNHEDCQDPQQVGCVHVFKGRSANIKFLLDGLDGWKFKRMQLVAESEDNPDKLNFIQKANLTPEMVEDFYVKIKSARIHPDEYGIIDLTGLKDGTKFRLIDKNKYAQNYFYQIEACNGDCKQTDPKIENEGKN
ncbi:MAG TPA: hypothetical protein VIS57_03385 [Xanthomonadales bacterium]